MATVLSARPEGTAGDPALEKVNSQHGVEYARGKFGTKKRRHDLGLRIKNADGRLTLEDAIARVADVARQSGKAWGCPAATVERMQELHAQGATLLAHGGDFMAMMNMLRDSAADFDRTLGIEATPDDA